MIRSRVRPTLLRDLDYPTEPGHADRLLCCPLLDRVNQQFYQRTRKRCVIMVKYWWSRYVSCQSYFHGVHHLKVTVCIFGCSKADDPTLSWRL